VRHPRTHLRLVAVAFIAAALLVPAPVAKAGHHRSVVGTHKMHVAEARLLRDINRIRKRSGRKPLRLDKRTSQVARARSSDMAAKRYFAHVEPDGDDAARILRRRHIGASKVTENIGHTMGLTLRGGSKRMAGWWYRSAPHRRQMLARKVNYVGIGMARRGSRFTYTAIFTRSRDRTRPRVVIDDVGWRASEDGAQTTVEWHGVDPHLAIGRTGIERYDVQRRDGPLDWSPVGWGVVGATARSVRAFGSGDEQLRVRAVDKAGNVSAWAYARVDIPATRPRWS
jgi:uncharacterized protein YkwD